MTTSVTSASGGGAVLRWKAAPAGSLTTTPKGTVVAAFAQTGVVDHEGDYTEPGAFPSGRAVPISAWGHASWQPGYLPVGRAVIREDGGWAVAKGRLFLDMAAGKETFAALAGLRELTEWSYGFLIIKSRPERIGGAPVRVLEKLDVYEVSPVLKGAGKGTHTVSLAGTDPAQLALRRLYEANVRALAGVDGPVDLLGERLSRLERDNLRALEGVRPGMRRSGRSSASAADVEALRARLNGVDVR
jgi:hypothetical protein